MHTGRVGHTLNLPKGAELLAPTGGLQIAGMMWTDAQVNPLPLTLLSSPTLFCSPYPSLTPIPSASSYCIIQLIVNHVPPSVPGTSTIPCCARNEP